MQTPPPTTPPPEPPRPSPWAEYAALVRDRLVTAPEAREMLEDETMYLNRIAREGR